MVKRALFLLCLNSQNCVFWPKRIYCTYHSLGLHHLVAVKVSHLGPLQIYKDKVRDRKNYGLGFISELHKTGHVEQQIRRLRMGRKITHSAQCWSFREALWHRSHVESWIHSTSREAASNKKKTQKQWFLTHVDLDNKIMDENVLHERTPQR